MTENGHAPIETIWVTGGLIKNRLYLQAHADATGCTLVLPHEQEAVLLGSAVLGVRAAGVFSDLPTDLPTASMGWDGIYRGNGEGVEREA